MPSFSIEVTGEANPLTENLLVHSLTSAASSDPNSIQTGTKQLQQWETYSGYYRHLQSAYLDQRLPLEIRYLAIIQLKNGIDKYWRKTALNAVPKEDKLVIRSRLIDSILNEYDHRLAVQNALVIAKIARFEYPNDWPEALSSLTNTLRSHVPPYQLARALLALLHIVKELATGRLQKTRQNLQAATPEIVHVLGTLYASTVDGWQNASPDESQPLMQQSLLTMKVLRRSLIVGYEHPNRNSEVNTLWQLTQNQLDTFIQFTQSGHPQVALVEKHMLQLAKLHHEMSRDHPAAFALLPNSVDLVYAYWNLTKTFGESFGSKEVVASAVGNARIGSIGDAEDESKLSIEKLALKGLLVLRACVKMVHNPSQTFKYRTPEDKEEKSQATSLIRQDLLTDILIREVMETLVTRFFVFRASDLREWEEEPEEWEKREEGDGEDWEFSVRSCSEKLFLDLAINYKDMLVQPLLQVFFSVATPTNEDVLFKDSVYTAIGLAAPVLHEQLDFDAFIRDVMVVEVGKQNPGFNILRRRAAILLGQWISVKIGDASRPLVYQIFQHLLDTSEILNDQVVRVTAGRQLKNVCESWEFSVEQFLPYADLTLGRLMALVEEVESTETKMSLLNTLSVIVENLDLQIRPFAERIVSMLPPLWEGSGEEHLMKQAILTILARLVTAMKADSVPMHSLVFPIIRGAVEPGSETEVYLLEDALDLWASMLVQTPQPATEEALALVQFLFPLFERGSDSLRKAIEITESYVLLAPEYMLSDDVRYQLFSGLSALFGTLRPEANGMVCNLIEVIIRTAERVGGEEAVARMSESLESAGLFGKILQGLEGSWSAHCTTGPKRVDAPVDGIVETDYFAIFARLTLGSLQAFCRILEVAAAKLNTKDDQQDRSLAGTMKWLLEEWFSHFENIGDPSRRKLVCLALTKLLETAQPWILVNLQSLMTVWTDVITELREDEADTNSDTLVYNPGSVAYNDSSEAKEIPEDARRRDLMYADVVHRTNLPTFVQQCLRKVIDAVGGEERFRDAWLINVDRDVLESFARLGVM